MLMYIRCSLSSSYWKKLFLEPSGLLGAVPLALVLSIAAILGPSFTIMLESPCVGSVFFCIPCIFPCFWITFPFWWSSFSATFLKKGSREVKFRDLHSWAGAFFTIILLSLFFYLLFSFQEALWFSQLIILKLLFNNPFTYVGLNLSLRVDSLQESETGLGGRHCARM